MTSTSTCPDLETLDDLLANRLSSDRAEVVRAHIARCTTCRQRMSEASPPGSGGNTAVAGQFAATTIMHAVLSPPRGPGELGWLGEYRVLGVLGEGGMAIVYDAEDPKLRRMVALKVLKPEINSASSRERFLGEARVVASLSSTHVVDVYAVGEVNSTPFMAMEKLRGETLAKRLQRDRWLPVADALRLTREAAEGLVDLHARGLIHRDLKPDNLWLESHADGQVEVKLIDFGIARQVTGDPGLTVAGQVIGTPVYMAPEQASGGDVDTRADLYSLGCVLYTMLAGRTPFDSVSPNTLAVLSAVIRGEIDPIASVVPSLSPSVAALVTQLLEHDKENRPASAAQLVSRLRELEREEQTTPAKTKLIAAGAAASKRRTPRQAPRWSVAFGVLAIVAALAVGGWALSKKIWPASPVVIGPGPPTSTDPSVKPPVPLEGTIKVGLLFSQSDATALPELPILEAVQFAIEEINAADGVLGRRIEPVVADGASNPAVFAQKAAKLIDEDHVEAIFGCWTSPARKRVAEICNDPNRDRLLFYPGNHEGIEEYKNVVYLGGAPNQVLIPLIRYAYADLQRRKVFVVGTESVNSRVVNRLIEHEITQLGGMVADSHHAPHGEADFKLIAAKIKESGADFVVSSLPGGENQLLFRALRGAGIGPPQVPTAWLSLTESNLLHYSPQLAGDYTAGCYSESEDKPTDQSFVRRYRLKFGEPASDTMEAAYYGVYLWKHAVEKAQSTRTADVRTALQGLTFNTIDRLMKIDPANLHAWQIGQVSQVVLNPEGRLNLHVVHRTPRPIEPQLYPTWETPAQWNDFRDMLFQEWGQNWEAAR